MASGAKIPEFAETIKILCETMDDKYATYLDWAKTQKSSTITEQTVLAEKGKALPLEEPADLNMLKGFLQAHTRGEARSLVKHAGSGLDAWRALHERFEPQRTEQETPMKAWFMRS